MPDEGGDAYGFRATNPASLTCSPYIEWHLIPPQANEPSIGNIERVLSLRFGGHTMDFEKHQCQFCGRPAKQYVFAAFCCESEDCVDKAREERGGPGGHMKAKIHGGFVDIKER